MGLTRACACLLAAALLSAPPLLGPPPLVGQTPSAPPAPSLPAVRFIVVLDAAHGGEDAGARFSDGTLEKNLTLALSVRLRSLLNARGFTVITTRESDQLLDVNRRAEIANHIPAQACISLHATASGLGVHLFASSLAPAPRNRITAWKTAQSGWTTQSLALVGVVNSTLQQAGFTVALARTNLPSIDSMTCPAIAIEIAPPVGSDHKPSGAITDPEYQSHVAEALAAALLEWRTEVLQP